MRSAMMTPPIIMIGAPTIIDRVIKTTIWACCTSLVVRLMSVGAPNCETSRAEKSTTPWNTWARVSRPKAIDVRAAR
ncbi:MAG: hypothetical protein BWY91_02674 [bacterium ADurb.BinA028]|nr:MAG: hypothetical protein BWY91_02674 [bacterium ADurb.BinA028]